MPGIETKGGQVVLVDEVDLPIASQFTWYFTKNPKRGFGYATTNIGKKLIYMHRMIMQEPDGMVDHINRDGMDNRRCNLRLATFSQNQRNRLMPMGRSQYRGVCWLEERGKWRAAISINSRLKNLGNFAREVDAAAAYNAALRKVAGDFGVYNELPAGETASISPTALLQEGKQK